MKNLITCSLTVLSAVATAAAWLYNSVIAVTMMKVLVCIAIPLALLTGIVITIAAALKPEEVGEKLHTELKWYLWPFQLLANVNQLAQFTYFCSIGATGWALVTMFGLILSVMSIAVILHVIQRYRTRRNSVLSNTLRQAMAEEKRLRESDINV